MIKGHLDPLVVSAPCFVMQYLVSILVWQSLRLGRGNWLLYLNCVLAAMWLFLFYFFQKKKKKKKKKKKEKKRRKKSGCLYCSMSLPHAHGGMGWSIASDCCFSWSYSLKNK